MEVITLDLYYHKGFTSKQTYSDAYDGQTIVDYKKRAKHLNETFNEHYIYL